MHQKILNKILVQVIRWKTLSKMRMINKTMTVGFRTMTKMNLKKKSSKRKTNHRSKLRVLRKAAVEAKVPWKTCQVLKKVPKRERKNCLWRLKRKNMMAQLFLTHSLMQKELLRGSRSRYYKMQINNFIEINIMKVVSSTSRNINRLQTVDRDFCFPQSQTENQDQDSLRSSIQEGFAEWREGAARRNVLWSHAWPGLPSLQVRGGTGVLYGADEIPLLGSQHSVFETLLRNMKKTWALRNHL